MMRHLVRLSAGVVALGFATAATLHAQDPRGARRMPRSIEIIPDIGLYIGAPAKATVRLGLGLAIPRGEDPDGETWVVSGSYEPGLAARKFLVGLTHLEGSLARGISVRAGVMRTYGKPWLADPDRRLVGGEVRVSAALVHLAAGYYTDRTPGLPKGRGAILLTWGVGF